MEKPVTFKSRLSAGIFLLASVFIITDSCSKDNSNGDSGGGGSKGPGVNEVFIQNMAFNPGTKSVAINTTITWTNKDGTDHTVTSNSGLFDSGVIKSNGTFSHTFTSEGTYTYRCTIHPAMTGTIQVNAVAEY